MSEEGSNNTAPSSAHDRHFAAGVSGGEVGSGTPTGGEYQDSGSYDAGDVGEEKKSYSQEDLDKMFQRRLKRQETRLRQQLQEEAAEEARKSRMDEVERLRVEREEALQASQAAIAQANQEIMLARAEAVAATMGVPDESLKYITRLVDLSEADREDPDTIRGAVAQVLKDVPALAAPRAGNGAAGEWTTIQSESSLVAPMGRDRQPAAGAPKSDRLSPKEIFNQRLRQRSSQR